MSLVFSWLVLFLWWISMQTIHTSLMLQWTPLFLAWISIQAIHVSLILQWVALFLQWISIAAVHIILVLQGINYLQCITFITVRTKGSEQIARGDSRIGNPSPPKNQKRIPDLKRFKRGVVRGLCGGCAGILGPGAHIGPIFGAWRQLVDVWKNVHMQWTHLYIHIYIYIQCV